MAPPKITMAWNKQKIAGKTARIAVLMLAACLMLAAAFMYGQVKAIRAQSQIEMLNIDFGVSPSHPSPKTTPGDYWNTVAAANDDYNQTGLKYSSGGDSPVAARLINLGGTWDNGGLLGVFDSMLDTYSYPQNDQEGNAQVVLYKVPPGIYDIYVYGRGTHPLFYGDYAVSAGTRYYGRKSTASSLEAVNSPTWIEGFQYVKFSNVKIRSGEKLEILIRPNEAAPPVAMISGLQLVPARKTTTIGKVARIAALQERARPFNDPRESTDSPLPAALQPPPEAPVELLPEGAPEIMLDPANADELSTQ